MLPKFIENWKPEYVIIIILMRRIRYVKVALIADQLRFSF